MSAKVEAIITQRIIDGLEKGIVAWHKPWVGVNCEPRNAVTKIPYRGINVLMCLSGGFSNPNYLTLKQAKAAGVRIKYEHFKQSTPIVYWQMLDVDDKDNPGKTKHVPLMRFYQVWNVEQLESIPEKWQIKAEAVSENEMVAECEAVMANYTDAPEIREEIQDRAFYNERLDTITINPIDQFSSAGSFYATLFHELAHSTKHKNRLGRDLKSYAYEELVAEIAAAFLCNRCKIDTKQIFDNSVAYVQSWLKALKNDSRMIIKASQLAQKAVDHVLGVKKFTKKQEDDHQVAA